MKILTTFNKESIKRETDSYKDTVLERKFTALKILLFIALITNNLSSLLKLIHATTYNSPQLVALREELVQTAQGSVVPIALYYILRAKPVRVKILWFSFFETLIAIIGICIGAHKIKDLKHGAEGVGSLTVQIYTRSFINAISVALLMRHRVMKIMCCVFLAYFMVIQSNLDDFYSLNDSVLAFTYVIIVTWVVITKEEDFEKILANLLQSIKEADAWSQLAEVIPDGVIVLDRKLKMVYHNNSVARILSDSGESRADTELVDKILEIDRVLIRGKSRSTFESIKCHYRKSSVKIRRTQSLGVSGSRQEPQNTEQEVSMRELFNFIEYYLASKANSSVPKESINESITCDAVIEGGGKVTAKHLEFKLLLKTVNEQLFIIIVISDNTERYEIIKLQELVEHKTRMLSSVSHELRTPLNASIIMLDCALNDKRIPRECAKELLEPAYFSTKFLLSVINDVIDFSQIESNQFKLLPSRVNLLRALEPTLKIIEFQASLKKLKFEMKVDGVLRGFTTDINRLTQVMLNLLSNAIKFTMQGTITLRVSARDGADDFLSSTTKRPMVRISVKDSGIGIEQENIPQLFSMFGKYERNGLASLNSNGAGFGLTISQHIAKQLGGPQSQGIKVKSAPGAGSKFSFEVTSMEVEAQAKDEDFIMMDSRSFVGSIAEEFSDQNSPRHNVESLFSKTMAPRVGMLTHNSQTHNNTKLNTLASRQILDFKDSILEPDKECNCPWVLLVDDNDFNQYSLSRLLKSLGIECDTAYNGQDALDKIMMSSQQMCQGKHREPYRLVLMDLDMPVMDGIEATKRIRAMEERSETQQGMIIIACTALAHEYEISRCWECGMNDIMNKPLSKVVLEAKMKKWSFLK